MSKKPIKFTDELTLDEIIKDKQMPFAEKI